MMKKENKASKGLVISRIHYNKPKLHISEDPQDMATVLAVIAMSLYFVWRMFYITPSYEELHDYFYFISKGPIYAATNWSAEGNHIGYNFLASLLNNRKVEGMQIPLFILEKILLVYIRIHTQECS